MTFQQLDFVVEVARCESINKAAALLYTSQSNVSNNIKALEEELGIDVKALLSGLLGGKIASAGDGGKPEQTVINIHTGEGERQDDPPAPEM